MAEDWATLLLRDLLLFEALSVERLHHLLRLLLFILLDLRRSEFLLSQVGILLQRILLFLRFYGLNWQVELLVLLLLLLVSFRHPNSCNVCTVETVSRERIVVLVVVAAFDLDHAAVVASFFDIVTVHLLIGSCLLLRDVL